MFVLFYTLLFDFYLTWIFLSKYEYSPSLQTEEMPQIETRVVLVQEAGRREELLKALEVCMRVADERNEIVCF